MLPNLSNNLKISDKNMSTSHPEEPNIKMDLPKAHSTSHTLSLRANFAWAFIGNAIAAFCTWLLLVLLTKMGAVEMVGTFSVAQAVITPIGLLLSFKLRVVQVTDAKNDYEFGHYLALRIFTAGAAVLVTLIIAFLCYQGQTAIVIVLLAIRYALIGIREVFLAVMQKVERMDKMAISRILQGLLSLTMFGTIFWLSKSLELSIIGLVIARLIILIYDIPVVRKLISGLSDKVHLVSMMPLWEKGVLWKLAKLSMPLGFVAWLCALFTSIPRLVLDKYYGREEVGYFAAISSLLVAGTMVVMALGQTVTPRLAKYFMTDLRAYKVLLSKLLGVGVFLSVTGVIISILFGRELLTLLFKSDYAEYHGVFIRISIAGAVLFLFTFMNVGLQATRDFKLPVLIYSLAALTCGIFSLWLIPSYGMIGAVWALFSCYCVGFVGCSVSVVRAVKKKQSGIYYFK